jgi:hypothetical protein
MVFVFQLRNSLNYWLIILEFNDNANLVLTCEPRNSWFCNVFAELGQPPDASGFITGFPTES